MMRPIWVGMAAIAVALAAGASRAAELPEPIAAKGEAVVLQVHAEGAQIYECKMGTDGRAAWRFREPIASLFLDGKTIGRHYAGPTWEIDGTAVVGRVTATAPGATAKDVAWLKLAVTDRRGDGPLKDVTAVQRIDTRGGALQGDCGNVGALQSESYAADYVFLKKSFPVVLLHRAECPRRSCRYGVRCWRLAKWSGDNRLPIRRERCHLLLRQSGPSSSSA